jgi:hypothetical protein
MQAAFLEPRAEGRTLAVHYSDAIESECSRPRPPSGGIDRIAPLPRNPERKTSHLRSG